MSFIFGVSDKEFIYVEFVRFVTCHPKIEATYNLGQTVTLFLVPHVDSDKKRAIESRDYKKKSLNDISVGRERQSVSPTVTRRKAPLRAATKSQTSSMFFSERQQSAPIRPRKFDSSRALMSPKSPEPKSKLMNHSTSLVNIQKLKEPKIEENSQAGELIKPIELEEENIATIQETSQSLETDQIKLDENENEPKKDQEPSKITETDQKETEIKDQEPEKQSKIENVNNTQVNNQDTQNIDPNVCNF